MKQVQRVSGPARLLCQGFVVAGQQGAVNALLHLLGRHGRRDVVAGGAPCLIALGRDNSMAARAFAPFFGLLYMTAHAADGRIALGAFGDIGGMHGAVKGDIITLGLAFYRVAGATGHRVARVVTGLAVVNLLFMNKMVENHRFHGRALGIGLFGDRKHDYSRWRAAVCWLQGCGLGRTPQRRETRRASQGDSRQQKQ